MTGANHARWTGYFKTAEPQTGDELGTWTRLQLIEMDEKFTVAMQRAIRRGKERPIGNGSSAAANPQPALATMAVKSQESERPCSTL
jgi:hypothetical protein